MKMWHIASLVYVSEGMYEYLYAFWGASSQGNQECISFALAAYYTPQKGVKQLLFIATSNVCTYTDDV